jgi:hypothetical protein
VVSFVHGSLLSLVIVYEEYSDSATRSSLAGAVLPAWRRGYLNQYTFL